MPQTNPIRGIQYGMQLLGNNFRKEADSYSVKMADGTWWTYSDFARHTVDGAQIAPVDGDERRSSVAVDATWYMRDGPGAMADLSQIPALRHLMNRTDLAPGNYSFESLYNENSRELVVNHYRTEIGSPDWVYRSAVWGGTSFLLKGGTVQVDANGKIHLLDTEFRPYSDNFDFEASNKGWAFEQLTGAERDHFDPNQVGDTFQMLFEGDGLLISELNSENLSQYGTYGPNRDTYWRNRYCFGAGVLISMADGSVKSIETVEIGDMVLAFDAEANEGKGPLLPRRVSRLFVTEGQSLIDFNGVPVTPGHAFLTEAGAFRELREILASGGCVVRADGAVVPASEAAPLEGLHEVYNFEVEDLHTYVAGGWRVHNESVFSPDTEAGQQADDLIDRFARLSFADDPLEYIAFGSALRALGSTAVDSIAGDTPFDFPHVFGRFASNAVGSIGGYAARTIVTDLLEETGLPADIIGALGIFAESVGTAAAQIQAIRYVLSIAPDGSALAQAAQSSLDALDPDLFVQSAAVAAISSFAATKLADLIGLDPDLAPFLTAPAGAALNQIGQNLIDDIGWSSGLSSAAYNALGSVAANYLAGEIAEWDSEGEIIGSSVGSGLGGFIGQTLIPIPLLGTFIGAFVGDLLGGLLGGLIGGDTPIAWAYLEYDPVTGEVLISRVTDEGGGSRELVEDLASAVRDNINTVLMSVGGATLNPDGIVSSAYGQVGQDAELQFGTAPTESFGQDFAGMVESGVIRTLEQFTLAGGDAYAKRALAESLERARDGGGAIIAGASGFVLNDLMVAKDFQTYLTNIDAINALIATDPNGEEAVGWQILLQRAFELGLHRRHDVDWNGGWSFLLEEWGVGAEEVAFNYTGDRLFAVGDDAEAFLVGDVIPPNSKDTIYGDLGSDRIVVTGEYYDGANSFSGDLESFVAFDGVAFEGKLTIAVSVQIVAEAGHDFVVGGDLGTDIFGGAGSDTLQGGRLDDWLLGEEGDDRLYGLGGHGDYLDGGDGDDVAYGDAGDDWLLGGAGDDALHGGTGTDILEGGEDRNILTGGSGDDIYIHRGEGADRIGDDGGITTQGDRLVMAGTDSTDIQVWYSSAGEDIRLTVTGEAGVTVELLAQAYADWAGVETIRFADGVVWTRTELLARAQAPSLGLTVAGDATDQTLEGGQFDDVLAGGSGADLLMGGYGSDTYVVRSGQGVETVRDIGGLSDFDRLILENVASTAVTVQRSAIDPNVFVLAAGGIPIVKIEGLEHEDQGVDEIVFSDGVTWTRKDLFAKSVAVGTTGADTLIGTGLSETLSGGNGADLLMGGRGADKLIGGAGADTYRFSLGDGEDLVSELATDTTDRLEFGIGISRNDILVDRSLSDADDLILSIVGSGDRIILDEQVFNSTAGVEIIAFADGATWSRADLQSRYLVQAASASDDIITGFASADIMVGGRGNDVLNGAAGADTYRYALGDGVDRIEDSGTDAGIDRLVFEAGINPGDVRVERSLTDDSEIILYVSDGGVVLAPGISEVRFADGTIWTTAYVQARAITSRQTEADDVIVGSSGADIINMTAGNDVIRGGAGVDRYEYHIGDGVDLITDEPGGVTPADVLVLTDVLSDELVISKQRVTDVEFLLTFANGPGAVFLDSSAIGQIVFADGASLTTAGLRARYLAQAGEGSETLLGYSTADILVGGHGDDYLSGAAGADIYRFNIGDGHDFILDSGTSGVDVLAFGAGITAASVTVNRVAGDTKDVVLTLGDDRIYLDNFTTGASIDQITFADGGVWSAAQLQALATAATAITVPIVYSNVTGSSGNDELTGTGNNEIFAGDSGNDILDGGSGSDVFVFNIGDGFDFISDLGTGTLDSDRLHFGEGITPEMVKLSRFDSGSLIMTIGDNGDAIRLSGQVGNRTGIEYFEFDNGVIWTKANLFSLYAADQSSDGSSIIHDTDYSETLYADAGDDRLVHNTGSETYVFGRGDGRDVLTEGSGHVNDDDVLRFEADIDPEDILVTRSGGDFLLSVKGTTDSVLLVGQNANQTGVDRVEFANGVVWDRAALIGEYFRHGISNGNDRVLGSYLSDTFRGGPGDDDFTSSSNGSETYLFGLGDGNDVIRESIGYFSDIDRIVFDEGISPDDVTVEWATAADLIIRVVGRPDSIYIVSAGGQYTGVEQVMFADGTLWTKSQLLALAATDEAGLRIVRGTGEDEVVVGHATADKLIGSGGHDVLRGGAGSDVYSYALGDGRDTIQDTGPGTDTDKLVLAAGIRPQDVLVLQSASEAEDLILVLPGSDGAIYLDGQNNGGGIEQVVFSDGTIWLRSDIVPTGVADAGTAASEILTGTVLSETLRGGLGNDVLKGGWGADIYIFDALDGHDIVEERGGDLDVLEFGAGLSAGGMAVGRVGEDLSLSFGSGLSVLIKNQDAVAEGLVELFRFHDGTVLDFEDIKALYLTSASTSGADDIIGFSASDQISGGAGDDRLQGLSGADTYLYSPGDGEDTIVDSGADAGIDELRLGPGISISDVHVERTDATGVWKLTFDDLPGSVTVRMTSAVGVGLERVSFEGGAFWTAADIEARYIEAASTNGDDDVRGLETADVIAGGAGADFLHGRGGDDVLAGGDGDDLIDGGSGDDQLSGGNGDDLLSGDLGQDAYDGGAGNDTVDFRYSAADWTVNLALGTAATSQAVETLVAIENVTTSGGDDILIGNALANRLTSGGGADHLTGGDGDDILEGGAGGDVLDGGAGSDTAAYSKSASPVVVALVGPRSGGDAESDVLSNIENLTGSAHADRLTGDSGANVLDGGAGDDELVGASGDDSLIGGAGDDFLYGGDGIDSAIYSGTSADFSFVMNPDGTVVVTHLMGDTGADILSGVETLYFEGDQVWTTVEDALGLSGFARAAGGGGAAMSHGGIEALNYSGQYPYLQWLDPSTGLLDRQFVSDPMQH